MTAYEEGYKTFIRNTETHDFLDNPHVDDEDYKQFDLGFNKAYKDYLEGKLNRRIIMTEFDVGVCWEHGGYVTVEADTKEMAQKIVETQIDNGEFQIPEDNGAENIEVVEVTPR